MIKRLFFIPFFLFTLNAVPQKDSISLKNGIDKPSLLPIHHFGLFSSRINQNFKVRPIDNSSLNFTVASANTFHPFVEMYLPKDEATQNQMRQLIWFNRNFFQNQQDTPADYESIVIDAVFKNFRIDFSTKINDQQELGITLRSYLVTKGNYPFSIFTSDEFIEWFHSNIAGGEDPFGRKYYGLNQVDVKYTDRNGRTLDLVNNEFIFAGIEINHFYYPKIKKLNDKNIFLNFGSHLGINTSKDNPSLDLGFSGNVVKELYLKNTDELRFGFGSAILRRNLADFKTDLVQLGNNNYLASIEAMFEFTKYTKKGNYNSISINYQQQSSFSKKDEANYYQLVGDWQGIHSGWQNGFEKLYESQSAWSWVYTYGRKNYQFSLYLKQDLYLNNSPDVQTGFAVKIPISQQ